MAAGLAIGSMTAFTYDIVAPDARGMVQAFRRSIGEIGSFTGPLVGGLVASAILRRVAFLVFAPLHLLSAMLVLLVARESLGADRRRAVAAAAATASTDRAPASP